jgi:hypothetical protein
VPPRRPAARGSADGEPAGRQRTESRPAGARTESRPAGSGGTESQGGRQATEKCRQLAAAVAVLGSTGGEPAQIPDRYVKKIQARKRRRPNAVHTLVDHEAISEGTPLTLTTPAATEQKAMADWLAEDPRRSRATWVNDRRRPLLWEADGRQYAPSGLIKLMWELAKWEDRPVANQGTARWQTPDGDTLAALAFALQDAAESD